MIDIQVIGSGSAGNCTILRDGISQVVLDAGLPIRRIREAAGFSLTASKALLVTHRHLDHAKALPAFLAGGVEVYAPADVAEVFPADIKRYGYRFHAAVSGEPFRVGTFRVMPFDCEHDVPCLGYRLESTYTGETVLYLTDSYFLRYRLPTPDYLLAECNHDTDIVKENLREGKLPLAHVKRVFRSHMSIDTLLSTIRKQGWERMKQVHLMHLSDANSDEETFARKLRRECGCEVYVH